MIAWIASVDSVLLGIFAISVVAIIGTIAMIVAAYWKPPK